MFLRRANLIKDIRIGADGLIHVSFFRKGKAKQFEEIAVSKNNFIFNALHPSKLVESFVRQHNGIWCLINNEYFWISR